jgi:very-short-patch-repair endonuclease
MPPISVRFVHFLREAVAIKTKRVFEVQKYPSVMWFSELPRDLQQVRSPVITPNWPATDSYWLKVARVQERARPAAPEECHPWLEGVDLDSPGTPPDLNGECEQVTEAGERVRVPPPDEVREAWMRFRDEEWKKWAEKAAIARAVKPIYQKLFAIHQQMRGIEDTFDLFIGVGLFHSRIDPTQPFRRHLLAFPAELALDDRTGTLSVGPSSAFVSARVETEFLPTPDRAAIQPQIGRLQEEVEQLAANLVDQATIGSLLTRLVTPLNAASQYLPDLKAVDAAANAAVVSFAPALILRPRSTRALEALLQKIVADTDGENPKFPLTSLPIPWRKMLEDGRVWGGDEPGTNQGGAAGGPTRVYFPLPSNDEQSLIVSRADGSPGVVVQGPPGTGKSHTIANLISHYLALGQRVLVTAQTAQALEVLRDKMPSGLQQLCVSLLGDSRESDRELRRSVDGILNRRQRFSRAEYDARVAQLEQELTEHQTRVNDFERTLHQSRAKETQPLEPLPGYQGTRGAIARIIRDERARFAWLTDNIPHLEPCPAYDEGWEALATYHASLDSATRAHLALELVDLPFDGREAATAVRAIEAAKAAFPTQRPNAQSTPLPAAASSEDLGPLENGLKLLAAVEATITEGDGRWIAALRMVLLRNTAEWHTLLEESRAALAPLTDTVIAAIVNVQVTQRSPAEARRDLARLEGHYAAGGTRKHFGVLKPAVVKETDWVEQAVTVEDLPVRTPEDVSRARKALDGLAFLEAAWLPWQRWSTRPVGASPRSQVTMLRTSAALLGQMLDLAKLGTQLTLDLRQWLAGHLDARTPTATIVGVVQWRLAELRLTAARAKRDELVAALRTAVRSRSVDPVFQRLTDALLAEIADDVASALVRLATEKEHRSVHKRYLSFLASVRPTAPKLVDAIVAAEGTPVLRPAFLDFEFAWNHRRAQDWLETMLSKERIEAEHRAARDERQRVQETLAELTSARAWSGALERIDDLRRATLTAWAQAVARIPATGPNVFMRRAQAQRLLGGCLDAIPAWVVSLARLYETIEPTPGLFDIAIVDEASQCWLDSLVLFYLAKKVIIVGDDKQISPTVVGVAGSEIDQLASAFIPDLQFRSSFNLESSLFDHGKRYLADGVPLREHFRCVPEIIRFSNQHFYPENPLLPLRQVGKDRLQPLMRTYLPNGLRAGDINDIEAQAIVDAIAKCHVDPAYEGTDFGVICLQGDMQGERVEELLLDRLGTDVFRTRNLRCGNPYVFQGDERDVMFMSMVAAPNAAQRSLTGAMFEQRFNVAMSRARDQMWLFHSIQEDELGANCLRRHILNFFKTPPAQSIHGSSVDIPQLRLVATRAVRNTERAPRPFDSWFEVDVALALATRGYTLSAQVEVAHKRIDLVIEGNEGIRLAVECDGEAWHGADQYAADVARQRQLERAEWRFVRVRESLFYCDEERAIRNVIDVCEELGIEPGGRAKLAAQQRPAVRPSTSPPSGDDDQGPQLAPVGTGTVPPPASGGAAAATDADIDADEEDRGEGELEADNEQQQDVAFTLEPTPATALPRNLQLPLATSGKRDYPDPRTAPQAGVRDAVLDVIRHHGPMTKAAIYAQYRDGCPKVERAGKALRQTVNRALGNLEHMQRVESRDEGTTRSTSEVVYRLPDQPWISRRPSLKRDLDDVPLSELALEIIAQGALREGLSVTELRSIIKNAARVYGVSRVGDQAQSRLRAAARLAVDKERWALLGL